MSWMLTRGGRDYAFAEPSRNVALEDIAQHLSRIARFNGATSRPYSVAEHSLLVSEICEREYRLPPGGLLAALLHDAHEAYIGDVIQPVKAALGEFWHGFEAQVQKGVLHALRVSGAYQQHRDTIKRADLQALATERRDLMAPHVGGWECLHGVEPVEWVDLRERSASLTCSDWSAAFLDRHGELREALAHQVDQLRVQRSDDGPAALCRRMLDPEDLGYAVSPAIRDAARRALGIPACETR